MKLTIPLYVCQHRGQYTVRPLLFAAPTDSDPKLEHALQRLTRKLREVLHRLGERLRHDELARYAFAPSLEYHRIEVPIELRRQVVRVRMLFVIVRALGRRIAFTPALPELWFELASVDHLVDRAAEVLSAHFRRRENEAGDNFVRPEEYALGGGAWVSDLKIEIAPTQITTGGDDANRAFIGDAEPVSGEQELFRVGRTAAAAGRTGACGAGAAPGVGSHARRRVCELSELTGYPRACARTPDTPSSSGKTTPAGTPRPSWRPGTPRAPAKPRGRRGSCSEHRRWRMRVCSDLDERGEVCFSPG